MRVAYDHQIFSGQEYGGVSRYFFEVARRIRAFDGYEVDILCPLFVNKYLNSDRSIKVWGKHVAAFPVPKRVTQMFNAGLVGWKLHRDPPDIVHETYYLRKKLAGSRTKSVVTVYDMIYEKFPQFFPNDDPTTEDKRAAVQRADHIICISESTRSDLVDMWGIDRNRTSVVHLSHTARDRKTDAMPAITDRPYIAYVGARVGYKNFSGLLRAFGSSEYLRSNFSIVCFGGVALTSEDRREMALAKMTPEQVIHLKGSDDLLENVYRSAMAFVYPSLFEGFGLPALEAMSAGCPVVTSKAGSLGEICEDAAEYFDPDEPESIAQSIERVVTSSERRQELIALGQIQIRKFSWDKCAKQTAAIYEAVSKR